jgi:hypothetical protein
MPHPTVRVFAVFIPFPHYPSIILFIIAAFLKLIPNAKPYSRYTEYGPKIAPLTCGPFGDYVVRGLP